MIQEYGVYYRAHVQDIGWQGWVKALSSEEDGGVYPMDPEVVPFAGTVGQLKRMEAIEIAVVNKVSEFENKIERESDKAKIAGKNLEGLDVEDLFGKSMDELQTAVRINKLEDGKYLVNGGPVYFVKDYTGYSSDEALTSGNYVVLLFKNDDAVSITHTFFDGETEYTKTVEDSWELLVARLVDPKTATLTIEYTNADGLTVSEEYVFFDETSQRLNVLSEEDTALLKAKQEATQELNDYVADLDLSQYTENMDELLGVLNDASNSFHDATTAQEVEDALADVLAKLEAIETNDEKAERELAEAKETAKGIVEDLYNDLLEEAEYTKNQAELDEVLANAKEAIDEAADKDAVETETQNALDALKAVETDAQVAEKELAKAKEDAKKAIDDHVAELDTTQYTENMNELLDVLNEASNKLHDATTPDEVQAVLEEVLADIDAIETNDEIAARELEEAKQLAKDQLDHYAEELFNGASYDKADEILENAKNAIDEATSADDIRTEQNKAAKELLALVEPVNDFTATVEVKGDKATIESAMEAAGEEDLLGKELDELQSDVVVSKDNKVTGHLNYVTDYTEFNTKVEAEQEGNYLVLHVTKPEGVTKVTAQLVPDNGKGEVELTGDYLFMVHFTNPEGLVVRVNYYVDDLGVVSEEYDLSGLEVDTLEDYLEAQRALAETELNAYAENLATTTHTLKADEVRAEAQSALEGSVANAKTVKEFRDAVTAAKAAMDAVDDDTKVKEDVKGGALVGGTTAVNEVIDQYEDSKLFGKAVEELQENDVAVAEGKVTGHVNYVEDYDGYDVDAKGNFVALRITNTYEGVEFVKTTAKFTGDEVDLTVNGEGNEVLILKVSEDNKTTPLVVRYYLNDTTFVEVSYDLSELVLQSELDVAKLAAKAELDSELAENYVEEDYTALKWEELQGVVEAAKADIDTATDAAELPGKVETGKTNMEAVETKAEMVEAWTAAVSVEATQATVDEKLGEASTTYPEGTLYGHSATDLQDVTVEGNVLTGTLNYIEDYSEAFGEAEKAGNYLAMYISNQEADKIVVTKNPGETITLKAEKEGTVDEFVVFYVTQEDLDAEGNCTITVSYQDANGEEILNEVYDIEGLVLTSKLEYDKANALEELNEYAETVKDLDDTYVDDDAVDGIVENVAEFADSTEESLAEDLKGAKDAILELVRTKTSTELDTLYNGGAAREDNKVLRFDDYDSAKKTIESATDVDTIKSAYDDANSARVTVYINNVVKAVEQNVSDALKLIGGEEPEETSPYYEVWTTYKTAVDNLVKPETLETYVDDETSKGALKILGTTYATYKTAVDKIKDVIAHSKVEEYTEAEVYGKQSTDLQVIVIDNDAHTITGTLKYVDQLTDFDMVQTENNKGNFIALKISNESEKLTTAKVKYKYGDETEKDYSDKLVLRVTDAETVLKVLYYDDADLVAEVDYDLSGLTLNSAIDNERDTALAELKSAYESKKANCTLPKNSAELETAYQNGVDAIKAAEDSGNITSEKNTALAAVNAIVEDKALKDALSEKSQSYASKEKMVELAGEGSDICYGKSMDELQKDVTIEDGDSDYEHKVKGTLNYIAEYPGFSSVEDEQSGNYIVLLFANENAKTIQLKCYKDGESVSTDKTFEDTFLLATIRVDDKSKLKVEVTYTDAEGTSVTETYTFAELTIQTALDVAKETAIADFKAEYDAANYSRQAAFETQLNNAADKIKEATSEDEIAGKVDEAKTAMEAVPTDAELDEQIVTSLEAADTALNATPLNATLPGSEDGATYYSVLKEALLAEVEKVMKTKATVADIEALETLTEIEKLESVRKVVADKVSELIDTLVASPEAGKFFDETKVEAAKTSLSAKTTFSEIIAVYATVTPEEFDGYKTETVNNFKTKITGAEVLGKAMEPTNKYAEETYQDAAVKAIVDGIDARLESITDKKALDAELLAIRGEILDALKANLKAKLADANNNYDFENDKLLTEDLYNTAVSAIDAVTNDGAITGEDVAKPLSTVITAYETAMSSRISLS